jgi:APA family basic amino acid/polyamine antiporter
MFFNRFGRVHPRFRTPAFAIVIQALWTGILIVSGSYETLFTYAILSAWVFYTLSVAAVWMLRRKAPQMPRPYRMWGYPYTLWMFLAVSIWFLADAVVNQPKASLIALLLAAAGVPFYFLWSRRIARTPIEVPIADQPQ